MSEKLEIVRELPDSTMIDTPLHHINCSNFESLSLKTKLPYLTWDKPSETDGIVLMTCVAPDSVPFASGWILVELLRSQLDDEGLFTLRSVKTESLVLSQQSRIPLVITRLELETKRIEEQLCLERIIPRVVSLMRLVLNIRDYRRYLCAVAHFLPAEKTRELWHLCAIAQQKRLKSWGLDLIETLHQFLSMTSQDFKTVRSARHLRRLVSAAHLYGRQLEWSADQVPGKRQLRLRVFRPTLIFPFGKKRVIGIYIAININSEAEQFSLPHLMRAVTAVLPVAIVVQGSFVCHQRTHHPIRHLYIELERQDGRDFRMDEIPLLRRELPREIMEHVEQLTHTVFIHRNPEEIYRALLTLSRELRYVRDLPQVMFWFESQDYHSLIFCICLARVVTPEAAPADQLLQTWPQEIQCLIDEIRCIGLLRKRYPKETFAFRLKFSKRAFLRKDYSVDLHRARQFVGSAVAAVFGEVRDYNGGLILKRNEVLNEVRRQLQGEEVHRERLLEKLFYSLSPASMQSCLSPEIVLALFRLVIQATENPPSRAEGYRLWHAELSGWSLIVVGSRENSFRKILERIVNQLHFDSLDLASTWVDDHGHCFMGYAYNSRHPSEAQAWKSAVGEGLDRWVGKLIGRQQLRLNFIQERSSIDPRISTARRSGSLMKMLYDGLTRMGKMGRPELAVAEHIDISADLKTYTFFLRETTWSNGHPVTAYDFEYAWKKLIDPKFDARYAYLTYPIRGAQAVRAGLIPLEEVGIHVANSHKLVVHLQHPISHFLELTTHWVYFPLCRKIDEVSPEWAYFKGDGYICNGPFHLAASGSDGKLRLVKNHRYWDAMTVRLEQIDIDMLEDPQIALERFNRCEMDWVGDPISNLPVTKLAALQAQGRLETAPSLAIYWCNTNTSKWPFNCLKIRQAFAIGLNRQELINRVLLGVEKPALSIVPQEMSCLDGPPFVDGDLDRARRLLEEGLEESGYTTHKLEPIVLNYSELEEQQPLAEELQRQWQAAFGIRILLEPIPWKTYLDHTLQNDYQIATATYYSYCYDPIHNFNHLRYRDECVNTTRWENATYQQYLRAADQTIDVATRRDFLKQAEELLIHEMPIIPVYCHVHRYVRRSDLKGFVVSPLGHIDLKWAYVD